VSPGRRDSGNSVRILFGLLLGLVDADVVDLGEGAAPSVSKEAGVISSNSILLSMALVVGVVTMLADGRLDRSELN